MTDLRQAAMQALEALESGPDVDPIFAGETITALKAALEQSKQEPVKDIGVEQDKRNWLARVAAMMTRDTTPPAAQPEQEPVETYIHHYRSQSHPNDFGIPKGHWWQAKQYADAVNTTPPKRPWQGLTEGERNDLEDYCKMTIGKTAFDAIEAKLKERNT